MNVANGWRGLSPAGGDGMEYIVMLALILFFAVVMAKK